MEDTHGLGFRVQGTWHHSPRHLVPLRTRGVEGQEPHVLLGIQLDGLGQGHVFHLQAGGASMRLKHSRRVAPPPVYRLSCSRIQGKPRGLLLLLTSGTGCWLAWDAARELEAGALPRTYPKGYAPVLAAGHRGARGALGQGIATCSGLPEPSLKGSYLLRLVGCRRGRDVLGRLVSGWRRREGEEELAEQRRLEVAGVRLGTAVRLEVEGGRVQSQR